MKDVDWEPLCTVGGLKGRDGGRGDEGPPRADRVLLSGLANCRKCGTKVMGTTGREVPI